MSESTIYEDIALRTDGDIYLGVVGPVRTGKSTFINSFAGTTRAKAANKPGVTRGKQWVAVELSEENKRQLLIPRGFGHGFVTLTDHVEFLYKADNYYAPEADGGIRWNDPELAIDWGVEDLILSQKDQNSPWLKDTETGF